MSVLLFIMFLQEVRRFKKALPPAGCYCAGVRCISGG